MHSADPAQSYNQSSNLRIGRCSPSTLCPSFKGGKATNSNSETLDPALRCEGRGIKPQMTVAHATGDSNLFRALAHATGDSNLSRAFVLMPKGRLTKTDLFFITRLLAILQQKASKFVRELLQLVWMFLKSSRCREEASCAILLLL